MKFVTYKCKICGLKRGLRSSIRSHLRERHFVRKDVSEWVDKMLMEGEDENKKEIF